MAIDLRGVRSINDINRTLGIVSPLLSHHEDRRVSCLNSNFNVNEPVYLKITNRVTGEVHNVGIVHLIDRRDEYWKADLADLKTRTIQTLGQAILDRIDLFSTSLDCLTRKVLHPLWEEYPEQLGLYIDEKTGNVFHLFQTSLKRFDDGTFSLNGKQITHLDTGVPVLLSELQSEGVVRLCALKDGSISLSIVEKCRIISIDPKGKMSIEE